MPRPNCRLWPELFSRSTQQVAQSLLGKTLVRLLPDGERLSGVIVEVEAYLDQAQLHQGQALFSVFSKYPWSRGGMWLCSSRFVGFSTTSSCDANMLKVFIGYRQN